MVGSGYIPLAPNQARMNPREITEQLKTELLPQTGAEPGPQLPGDATQSPSRSACEPSAGNTATSLRKGLCEGAAGLEQNQLEIPPEGSFLVNKARLSLMQVWISGQTLPGDSQGCVGPHPFPWADAGGRAFLDG